MRLLTVLLIAWMALTPSRAQEIVALTPGVPTITRIEAGAVTQFAFGTQGRESVTVIARSLDRFNDFNPMLRVYNVDGSLLAQNDNHFSNQLELRPQDALISQLRLNAPGVYIIEVSEGNVNGSGEVELLLTIDIDAPTPPPPPPPTRAPLVETPTSAPPAESIATPIPPEQVTEVRVENEAIQTIQAIVRPNEPYMHRFTAQPGDVITITARTRSNALDPQVALFFRDELLAVNDAHGTIDTSMEARDARIYNHIITRQGDYEVHVRGYDESNGDVLITIERSAQNAPLTSGAAQNVRGSIDAGGSAQFTFAAQAGDYITLTARGFDGFDPRLTLRADADPAPLYVNDDHGMSLAGLGMRDALIPNYRIEATGLYRVQVDSPANTAGAFELTITIRR